MLPQRIVVKVGTSTLTNTHGRIDRAFIADLTAQLAAQRAQNRDVVLVTSGAIRAGREAMGAGYSGIQVFRYSGVQENADSINKFVMDAPTEGHPSIKTPEHLNTEHLNTLAFKQAAAAIGQGLLMHTYTEAFAWREVTVAQVLLTRDDLSDAVRFANAQNTLRALLDMGVVPIINENDTVAVDEIKFGDNDTLAARVATLVGADLLLILSDVEGLYAQPPEEEEEKTQGTGNREQGTEEKIEDRRQKTVIRQSAIQNPDTRHPTPNTLISTVERIDAAIAALGGEATSGVGTGGMRTKIEAARIATQSGIRTVIARGRRERVIDDVVHERGVGTTFLPCPQE